MPRLKEAELRVFAANMEPSEDDWNATDDLILDEVFREIGPRRAWRAIERRRASEYERAERAPDPRIKNDGPYIEEMARVMAVSRGQISRAAAANQVIRRRSHLSSEDWVENQAKRLCLNFDEAFERTKERIITKLFFDFIIQNAPPSPMRELYPPDLSAQHLREYVLRVILPTNPELKTAAEAELPRITEQAAALLAPYALKRRGRRRRISDKSKSGGPDK